MIRKKYAIFPGAIRSKSDGDFHWVGYAELIRLHGLDYRECMNAEGDGLRGRLLSDYICIFPTSSGDYPIFKKYYPLMNNDLINHLQFRTDEWLRNVDI